MKNKVLRLNSAFAVDQKSLPSSGDSNTESIFIEGYASTTDIDRSGDVVPKSVWEAGIQNYLKNPIILAQHDYDDPIGRMTDYKVDDKGLWVKARISSAAEEVFGLIKDKILTAFSIGFRILDAEYNSAAEVFVIKELELVEISVVSVPCNQNTLFDLSKAFDNANDYKEFKQQFAPKGDSAKGLESKPEAKSTITKELEMTPEEIQKMLADAAAKAAEEATTKLLAAQAAEKAALEAKAKADAELEARVKAAVDIQVGQSGAERLLAEVTKRFEDQAEQSKSVLAGLEATLKEKADEIAKMQASKMSFADKQTGGSSYGERETAVMLSKISGKSIADTKYGRDMIEKTGQHMPSATWELEVSTNMEAEVRRRLVVAPLVRAVNMRTNVMTMPVNPEAGLASWVTNAQFGTTPSSGGTTANGPSGSPAAGSPHQLKEITLNAYKVATNEYLNYEEEEDSLLVIMPIVRDAMIRRLARSVDRAYLLGGGSGVDPVKGLALYDASSAVTPSVGGAATIANLRGLRKDLGAWGLDPAELVYVVSTEVYYDLLDDTTFQTMNQVGPQATLLTGQVGQVGNTPVLVSGEFPTKASGAATGTANIGAMCFAPGNFLAGNQRGLRFDTQELVETQRRVLVASMRTGLTQVTTNLGAGVSTLRWAA
jgi:HK97 family phage prohead protease/HK97 family phage major capsid protein